MFFSGIKNTLKLSNCTVNHDTAPQQKEQNLLEKRNFGKPQQRMDQINSTDIRTATYVTVICYIKF